MKKSYISPVAETLYTASNAMLCTSPSVESDSATNDGASIDGEDFGNGGVGLSIGEIVDDGKW